MNQPPGILVICNNEIAVPAIQQLFFTGSLKAIVVPAENKEIWLSFQSLLQGSGIKPEQVNKTNFASIISGIIREKSVDSVLVMTFSYILPPTLLNILPGKFINFHYGLLPKYRGAHPILAQMVNNESHSGVTVHIMDEKIDRGPIILQQKIPIESQDTYGMQSQKLGMLGASMALELLQIIQLGSVPPGFPQDETKAMYHKRPVPSDLMINWEKMNSQQVIRMINACNPWNKGAGARINNMVICLTHAEIINDTVPNEIIPGTIVGLDEKSGLRVVCADHRVVQVNIIYSPEGIFPSKKLLEYGIKINDRFLS